MTLFQGVIPSGEFTDMNIRGGDGASNINIGRASYVDLAHRGSHSRVDPLSQVS